MSVDRKTATSTGGNPSQTSEGLSVSYDLAQELVDIVVDNIEDDLPTLQACSLTNRSFFSSSRRYQFSRIELRAIKLSEDEAPPVESTLCQRFHTLITDSPHIASLVEDLRLLEGPQGDTWITEETLLPTVIAKLVNLKGISLGGWDDIEVDWGSLPASLQKVLLTVFQSPKLERARLWGISNVPRLLDLFPVSPTSKLRSVGLSGVLFLDEDSTPPSRIFNSQIHLLELEYGSYQHGFAKHLVDPAIMDAVQLRSLYVNIPYSSQASIIVKFIQAASCLEHLEIKMAAKDNTPTPEWEVLDLSQHLSLESMTVDIRFSAGGNHDPLRWVADVLETTSPAAPFRKLTINLYIKFRAGGRFRPALWSRVDGLMAIPTSSVPREFVLNVYFPMGWPMETTYNDLRKKVIEFMPNLHSRNLLKTGCFELPSIDIPAFYNRPPGVDDGIY